MIYRSKPDELTKKFADAAAQGKEKIEFELYGENVDYDELVRLIFESDQVICWW